MNKTFSILLAWDINDLREQGTYSAVVHAETQNEAERLAQFEMAEHDDGSTNPDDFEVIDVFEGANIWAADDLLKALKALVDPHYDEDNIIKLNGGIVTGQDSGGNLVKKGSFIEALEKARAAIARGEGRGPEA